MNRKSHCVIDLTIGDSDDASVVSVDNSIQSEPVDLVSPTPKEPRHDNSESCIGNSNLKHPTEPQEEIVLEIGVCESEDNDNDDEVVCISASSSHAPAPTDNSEMQSSFNQHRQRNLSAPKTGASLFELMEIQEEEFKFSQNAENLSQLPRNQSNAYDDNCNLVEEIQSGNAVALLSQSHYAFEYEEVDISGRRQSNSSNDKRKENTGFPKPAGPRKSKDSDKQAALGNILEQYTFHQAASSSSSRTTPANDTQDAQPPPPPLPSSLQGYEVVLLVDKRERVHATVISSLLAHRVKCELSVLSVGDFLWVARPPAAPQLAAAAATGALLLPADIDHRTVVLDTIAERKELQDLVGSVLDGRYQEQKTRLSSVPLPHCFYIVEAEYMVVNPYTQQHMPAMSIDAVKTAMACTYLQDKMHVLRTRGAEHTIRTLVQITRQVERRFRQLVNSKEPAPPSDLITFAHFQKTYTKHQCSDYGECLTYMLRQLKGCGLLSATAISKQFGTISTLGRFFRQVEEATALKIVADLQRTSNNDSAVNVNDKDGKAVVDCEDKEEAVVPSQSQLSETAGEERRPRRTRKRIGGVVANLLREVLCEEF
eukprot:gene28077-33904_t